MFSNDNEMKVHGWFRRNLKKRYPNAFVFKPQGGAYGKKGTHDFIFCIDGLFFSVEVKMPGNVMSPMQTKTKRDVLKAGGFSDCLVGRDETIFDKIDHWILNRK